MARNREHNFRVYLQ